jgi:hypothetical protein
MSLMGNGVIVPGLPVDDAADIAFTLVATKRALPWKNS